MIADIYVVNATECGYLISANINTFLQLFLQIVPSEDVLNKINTSDLELDLTAEFEKNQSDMEKKVNDSNYDVAANGNSTTKF